MDFAIMQKGEPMSRLIDADALLEGREDHEMISTHLIWNAPTIDAVELVRCKDCKHFMPPWYPKNTWGGCRVWGKKAKPDDYCSYAERITDEAKKSP